MPLAYDRAQQEWPWVGVINYWFFKRPSDDDKNQPYYYFRMVEPDFTPLPVYESMKNYIASTVPTLYAGVHQGNNWAIKADSAAQMIHDEGAPFGNALQTSDVTFSYHGTGIVIRWNNGANLSMTLDGAVVTIPPAASSEFSTAQTFSAETHTVHLTSTTPFLLDSVTVYDRSSANITPLIAIGAALGLLAVVGIGWALWRRFAEA
jgi:hypothetical protein